VVASVWTVGHANHEPDEFLDLLRRHDITAVADLRSHPYSRYVPHFGKHALAAWLREAEVAYVFLGRELGARSEDPAVYTDGAVDFTKLASTAAFCEGLERVRTGAGRYRIALLCAEHDPLDCHRAVLVARHLHGPTLAVRHIHADGHLEAHDALERRMLEHHGLGAALFRSFGQQVEQAYRQQAARLAWHRDPSEGGGARSKAP